MKPDEYARLRRLYDQVIDLPTGERLAHFHTLSADTQTIREVLALITAAEVETFAHLSRPLKGMLNSVNAPTLKPGDKLGVWQIEREIGQGGMGSVFLVERQDGHFTQTAALKFVKGLPHADTLNYFTRERQLLATLTHPNIARLLDGGATASGQPYLVMEYIDGVAIDIYCKQQQLTTAQILALFTAASDAVAFAHQQLIVHCDLKPSNLLVNKEGRPILLDFGIARLVDRVGTDVDENSESVAAANLSPLAAYTPRYASPEQRERGVVSTASDVYSLGVMLKELLSVSTTKNIELAAILKKATAPLPENRYTTVAAFTDDIARIGRSQPIFALPQTLAYVSQKFLQRRWPLVLAGIAFVAMAGGFTLRLIAESQRAKQAEVVAVNERDNATRDRDRAVVAELQAVAERDATKAAEATTARERDRATDAERVASRERNAAVLAAKKADAERNRATAAETTALQTSDFLVSVFDDANPNASSGDISASILLTRAEASIERDINRSPQTQVELYTVMGNVRRNMGNSIQARKNLQRAIEIERRSNRPLLLAKILAEAARLDNSSFGSLEAAALAREALQLREKHAPANSEDVASSLAVLGYVLNEVNGDLKESGELIQRSLEIRQRADPNSIATSESLTFAAHHAVKRFDYERAINLYEASLTIRNRVYGEGHPSSLRVREDLATAYRRSDKLAEAETIYRELLTARQKLHGTVNEISLRVMGLLATTLALKENFREAVQLSEESLRVTEKISGRESKPYTTALNNLSLRQSTLGQHAIAVENMREAQNLSFKLFPASHPTMALGERNIGFVMLEAKSFEAAFTQLKRALVANLKVHPESHPEVANTRLQLAEAAVALGKLDDVRVQIDAVERMPAAIKNSRLPILLRLQARIAALEMRNDEAMALFWEAERTRATIIQSSGLRTWVFKMPRLEFMAARGIDPALRIATATEMLAKIENVVDPNAPILNDLKRLQRP